MKCLKLALVYYCHQNYVSAVSGDHLWCTWEKLSLEGSSSNINIVPSVIADACTEVEKHLRENKNNLRP